MVYNKPPFAIVSRKSRGITEPKSLEGKKLGTPPTGTTFDNGRYSPSSTISTRQGAVEQIGIPVRVPMLAAGQIDAVLGYSFRVYVDLKDRGVPVEDIILLPMANYGLKLYGSAIIVNGKLAAEKPEAVSGFLRAFLHGLKDTIRNPAGAADAVLNATRAPGKGGRARAAADGDQRQYGHPGGSRQRPWRDRRRAARGEINQIGLTYTFRPSRRLKPFSIYRSWRPSPTVARTSSIAGGSRHTHGRPNGRFYVQ